MWDQASKTQCWKKLWHSDIVITFNTSGKEVICEILIVHLKKNEIIAYVSVTDKKKMWKALSYTFSLTAAHLISEKNNRKKIFFPLYSTNMKESKTWSNKFENIVIGCKWLNAQFWAVRAPSSCFKRGKLHMHFHQWTKGDKMETFCILEFFSIIHISSLIFVGLCSNNLCSSGAAFHSLKTRTLNQGLLKLDTGKLIKILTVSCEMTCFSSGICKITYSWIMG